VPKTLRWAAVCRGQQPSERGFPLGSASAPWFATRSHSEATGELELCLPIWARLLGRTELPFVTACSGSEPGCQARNRGSAAWENRAPLCDCVFRIGTGLPGSEPGLRTELPFVTACSGSEPGCQARNQAAGAYKSPSCSVPGWRLTCAQAQLRSHIRVSVASSQVKRAVPLQRGELREDR